MEIPLLFLVGADYLADHHGTVFQHRLNFVHGIFVAGMSAYASYRPPVRIVWIDGSAEYLRSRLRPWTHQDAETGFSR